MKRLKRSGSKKLLIHFLVFTALSGPAWAAQASDPKTEAPSRSKVLEILEQAKEALRGVRGSNTDNESIAREIAEIQAEAGDVRSAMKTVLTNPKYRDSLLSKIAVAEARAGAMEAAFETLGEIKTPLDRVQAYAGIAKAYSKVGLSVKAEDVFFRASNEAESAETKPVKTELFKIIAKAQADTGDVRGAYLTFNKIPDAAERARILGIMVKQQIEAGNFRLAREIADVIEKGENRSAAYKYIAIGFAKRNHIEDALDVTSMIEDDYYKGSAFAKIGEMQAKAGRAADAKQTFYHAKRIVKNIRDDRLSQAMILNDMAQCQWFAGMPADSKESFQEAKQIARSIKGNGVDMSLMLKDIALAEWSCGNKTDFKQTFQESKQAALTIPLEDKLYNRPIALKALAEALAVTGEISLADEAVQEVRKAVLSVQGNFKERSTLLSSMADSVLEAGDSQAAVPLLQQAAQLSQDIPDPEQKAWSLTDIAIYQSKANDQRSALQTMQKAQQAALQVPDDVQRAALLTNISISYVRLGFIQAALQLADSSGNENEKAETLGKITATQVREGDLDDAMKLAGEQNSALFKTRALIGIAKGLLEQEVAKRRPSGIIVEHSAVKEEESGGEESNDPLVATEKGSRHV